MLRRVKSSWNNKTIERLVNLILFVWERAVLGMCPWWFAPVSILPWLSYGTHQAVSEPSFRYLGTNLTLTSASNQEDCWLDGFCTVPASFMRPIADSYEKVLYHCCFLWFQDVNFRRASWLDELDLNILQRRITTNVTPHTMNSCGFCRCWLSTISTFIVSQSAADTLELNGGG